jgi:hypothetical protein
VTSSRGLRRLRPPRQRSAPDLRPGLLSVVALLFLLLPFLLLTTSIQKLTGIDLQLAGSTGELAPLPPGRVEAVEVRLEGADLLLRSAVRTRDVTAGQGDVTWHEERFPARGDAMDLAGLQQALLRLEALDPERQRALVLPSDDTSSTRVVALVDAIRSHRGQPLYPEVVLGGAELDRGSFGEDAP